MAVHINEIVSDVTAEPDQAGGIAGGTADWHEVERIRNAQAKLECDRKRTAAEGYND